MSKVVMFDVLSVLKKSGQFSNFSEEDLERVSNGVEEVKKTGTYNESLGSSISNALVVVRRERAKMLRKEREEALKCLTEKKSTGSNNQEVKKKARVSMSDVTPNNVEWSKEFKLSAPVSKLLSNRYFRSEYLSESERARVSKEKCLWLRMDETDRICLIGNTNGNAFIKGSKEDFYARGIVEAVLRIAGSRPVEDVYFLNNTGSFDAYRVRRSKEVKGAYVVTFYGRGK